MKLVHNILSPSGKPWVIHPAGRQFVYFNYNPVGDNTKVYSSLPNDWERNYTYDLLGRRLTYTEGELAESYTYNGGNLSTHTQSWSENGLPQTKTTHYHYTAHRLDSVRYDDALTVIYHYNNYGQIDSLYDESGVMCYQYGRMGEVTKETRIYALPFLSQPIALSTQYNYDSWGRVQNITYPDGEVVHYAYDPGGQLEQMYNSSYTYLDNVAYDRFGAKVSQTYGNGLVTNYSYNNLTRRLSNIATLNGNSQISTFAYTYDNVGNVTQVTSSCPWRNNQTFTESFTYDAADQLTAATEMQNQSYSLSVNYGNWGKINSYNLTQTDLQSNTSQSESQSYTYPATNSIGSSQTLFAPQQRTITDISNNVATETLTFGINGSLRKREVQSLSPYTEYYLFNGAANLKAYSNNGIDFAYYGYDAANTRTYKLSMLNLTQWVNGQPQPLQLQLQNAMFYPNAYINFNQNGEYTKHYYNGAERICSRLGDRTFSLSGNMAFSPQTQQRLATRIMKVDQRARAELLEVVEAGDIPIETPSVDITSLQPANPNANSHSHSNTGTPTDIFYYHTNHLGSTAFVTDNNATVTQGFLYAPFGEITTEFNARFGNGIIPKYSFNAKELDEETGMYYYEARYMAPPTFISRDPHFERYFWTSPYGYCNNNPLKYVDPTGMDWYQDAEGNAVFNKDVNENTKLGEGERYIGKTANWFGQTESDMQYLYQGDENGNVTCRDITITIHPQDGMDIVSNFNMSILSSVASGDKSAAKTWTKANWDKNCSNSNKAQREMLHKYNYMLKKKYGIRGGQVRNMKNAFNQAAKRAPVVGNIVTVADFANSYIQDGYSIGTNTVGSIGGLFGGSGGAYLGSAIGSMICPGVGTIIGAGIGGVIGGMGGTSGGKALYRKFNN